MTYRPDPFRSPKLRFFPSATTWHEACELGRRHNCEPDWEPPEDCQPTQCLPGSLEKIEEMRARMEAGVDLWHEDDRLHYSEDDS